MVLLSTAAQNIDAVKPPFQSRSDKKSSPPGVGGELFDHIFTTDRRGNNGDCDSRKCWKLFCSEQKSLKTTENYYKKHQKLLGKDEVPSSNLGSSSKKKHQPMAGVSFWVPAAKGRLRPPEILMSGGGRAAPAQFSAVLRIYAALAARPRRAVGSRQPPEDRFAPLRCLHLFYQHRAKRKARRTLGGRKTVICEFLGTGMISVMPVPLLSVHPREYSQQGHIRYVPSVCACRWTCPVPPHKPLLQAL